MSSEHFVATFFVNVAPALPIKSKSRLSHEKCSHQSNYKMIQNLHFKSQNLGCIVHVSLISSRKCKDQT